MRWGAGERGTCPLKIREKYISGQNHVKFRNFVNFPENYYKNLGIFLIFHTYFSGKHVVPS